MWRNEPRSLPGWIEDAYEILVSQTTDRQVEFSHERAQELLLAHEAFLDEPADVQYAIEHLLNYGWLYKVEGKLRITDPEY
ncbi:hypothetical protein [Haladaptatus halobius]|uniref:hypothetical protein n=1 Tax=Haladaptatus halobius TaxID=2884875 RepID=UPI001D0A24CC|nr:hypothetical protein [Haladaptatus halobius]